MIRDNGSVAQSPVTVFASGQALELQSRPACYMDGTFSAAPGTYTQLCVIGAELGTVAVSC